MKRLLVPVDFTENTRSVLATAETLARTYDAGMYLIYVAPPPDLGTSAVYGGFGPHETETDHRVFENQLNAMAKDLSERGINAVAVYRQGDVVETIAEEIASREIDHIVIGSHRHSSVYDLFLGSTTEGVLRRTTRQCPVTVVPMTELDDEPVASRKDRKIRFLVPVDFSVGTDGVIDLAAQMSKVFNGSVHLVHAVPVADPAVVGVEVPPTFPAVVERREAARSQLDAAAEKLLDANCTVDTSITSGAPVEAIIRDAGKQLADWLIMGSHGHGKLYELLVGSTTEGVLRQINVPVTIVACEEAVKANEPDDDPLSEEATMAAISAL